MKKLFYLGFCLLLAVGVGCAITDYELITDYDQISAGDHTPNAYIVNTNGKAYVRQYVNILTYWPDGTSDSMIWFADQDAQGNATYTTYNDYEPLYGAGAYGWPMDVYCSPEFTGCALVVAHYNVGDPRYIYTGDPTYSYDYDHYNPNCSGGRTVSTLTATTRYYGECGRARLSLTDRLSFLNMGKLGTVQGVEGLFYDLNHNNTTITLDNRAGYSTTLPLTGNASLFLGGRGQRQALLDISNPLLASSWRAYADFLANHGTLSTGVNLTYNGISIPFGVGGVSDIHNAATVLGKVNRRY